ncbi:metal-dependent hydrolase [Haloterrigena alkaliphila]|uniref:Metal-dependent hydrolase n=1 Tax=Haloterrigena alkaliphila TaxID=2816475 RepID=A0A8A2VCS8_9EURY|nr:metal-dependent hydrolase [Haloterrigena alkaliphila]QSW98212.1 metal-dependent hydrolase [Haloterrigena alkaliphila]
MWPLGHVAVAYLCYTLATRARFDAPPAHVPALLLVLGSQFPDLVDKPLAWYLLVLPTGRSLAHSLLLLVPLSLALTLVAARYGRSEYGVAFGIGALSHTFADVLPALWDGETTANQLLWPITPVEPYPGGPPTILGLLRDSATDPYFLVQFALAAIAFAYWRRHGYPGLEVLRAAVARVRPAPS